MEVTAPLLLLPLSAPRVENGPAGRLHDGNGGILAMEMGECSSWKAAAAVC
jgi:hypothetical protein